LEVMLFYFLFLFPLVALGQKDKSNECVTNRTLFSKLDSIFHPNPSEYILLLLDIFNAQYCLPSKSNCHTTQLYGESLTRKTRWLHYLMEKIGGCIPSKKHDEIWEKCSGKQDQQKENKNELLNSCEKTASCFLDSLTYIPECNVTILISLPIELRSSCHIGKVDHELMKLYGLPILY
ncbi:hypothetical protein GCK72_012939, partial [Caenorhabditis remanei]